MPDCPKIKSGHVARLLASSNTSWIVIIVGCLVIAFLTWTTPMPGISIGILSIVAAILVFIQPTDLQKFLFIILMSGLFYDETRAIAADAQGRETQRFKDQTNLQDRFNQILEDNNIRTRRLLSSANSQFNSTIEELTSVERADRQIQQSAQKSVLLSEQGVRQLTGGNSFPWVKTFASLSAQTKDYLNPSIRESDKKLSFLVQNSGDYTLSDVDIEIIRYDPTSVNEFSNAIIYHVGAIGPRTGRLIDYSFWPKVDQGQSDRYTIHLYYSGGKVNQNITYFESSAKSVMRFDETTDITVAPSPCVVFQLTSSDFKRPNYQLRFKYDSDESGLLDSDSGLPLDSKKEQERIAIVQNMCSAMRMDKFTKY